MATKEKCNPDEMLSWIKVAKECEKLQVDPSKITLPQLKTAVKSVFADGEGCYTKPTPPKGSGERTKQLSAYKKTAEKKTGTKFKDLY
jgi:hypothetical protein